MIHRLDAAPGNVHWGYFDATLKPVLSVSSGDTVVISSVSGSKDELPPPGVGTALQSHLDILDSVQPELGPHILTGPVAIEGAEPGDVLEVRVEKVELIQDWGFNYTKPGKGVLPQRFPERKLYQISIDLENNVAKCPWGGELPLAPFFGIMAVAPAPTYGRVSTIEPREYGGNIDNRELTAGSRLYLPVFVPGALFSVGDGHGCQGDGEVNLTALETALRGNFTLIVHKARKLALPRALTADHLITMAFHPNLNEAATIALDQMIDALSAATSLTAEDAYALCSLACSLRVTQLVDGNNGIHAMLPKKLLPELSADRFALE
ncbi:acetamidase/formamidase family protein [Pseudorhodoplanes sinuspersici]|uniref:Amidase n=1 Tax=Pseudorhodoplanes sinuspersici TaxID=1235591 RepID=A0A1W7A0U3_9HYPH|nr:acetamidase/formamidase family protein [Pseudorhodoplanes sinuspersici]ARQ02645.1 amidase [Pseudorhodoplanes sinuspersici]RKE74518.1 acetamidase/formamidase [Pseudorhodoplanes sinuspersici]